MTCAPCKHSMHAPCMIDSSALPGAAHTLQPPAHWPWSPCGSAADATSCRQRRQGLALQCTPEPQGHCFLTSPAKALPEPPARPIACLTRLKTQGSWSSHSWGGGYVVSNGLSMERSPVHQGGPHPMITLHDLLEPARRQPELGHSGDSRTSVRQAFYFYLGNRLHCVFSSANSSAAFLWSPHGARSAARPPTSPGK